MISVVVEDLRRSTDQEWLIFHQNNLEHATRMAIADGKSYEWAIGVLEKHGATLDDAMRKWLEQEAIGAAQRLATHLNAIDEATANLNEVERSVYGW